MFTKSAIEDPGETLNTKRSNVGNHLGSRFYSGRTRRWRVATDDAGRFPDASIHAVYSSEPRPSASLSRRVFGRISVQFCSM
jgi:hypothetical protein